MSDLFYIVLYISLLFAVLFFLFPIIFTGVTLNFLIIIALGKCGIPQMWVFSFLLSILLTIVYLRFLNVFKELTNATDMFIVCICSFFVFLGIGITTQTIVPTYKEIKMNDYNIECHDNLVINACFFEEKFKTVLINRTGEDLYFTPMKTSSIENERYYEKVIPFLDGCKLNLHRVQRINPSFVVKDVNDMNISEYLMGKKSQGVEW